MSSYWETSQSISSIRTEELPAKRDSVILCNMFSPPFKEQQARRGSLPLQLIPAPVSCFYPGAWRLKVTLEKKNYSASLISICIPTFLCMSLLHLWECILWVSCKIKPDFRKYRFALRRGEGLHSPFPPCFPGKQDKLLHNLYQAPTAGRRTMWQKASRFPRVAQTLQLSFCLKIWDTYLTLWQRFI